MKKIYLLEPMDIINLRGIIRETLNRQNLSDSEVIEYWNEFEEWIQEDAAVLGINDPGVELHIVDFLEENFPKYEKNIHK